MTADASISAGIARRDFARLALAAACWGGGTVVSKQAVAEIPPFTLLFSQLAASVAVLALVARLRGGRLPNTRDGRLLGRLGLLNPGLAYALSLFGLTEITASLSVLAWAMEPIFILFLAALVLGESLGPRMVVPSVAAVLGLGLTVVDAGASGSLFGITLTIAGVVVCAVYTVAARRWLPTASDSTLGVVLAQQTWALGLAGIVVAGLAFGGVAILPTPPTLTAVVSTIASGLQYYALAYLAYLGALRTLPASLAAASFYLIPIFGLASAGVVGERLNPLQWLGAALVVASVAVLTLRPRAARLQATAVT